MLKLVELAPNWTADGKNRHGMGVSFLCPVHRNHRLAIPFAVPLDGGPRMTGYAFYWERSGETFEDLTLGPSVDASGAKRYDNIQTPCWHGFITGGIVQDVKK